MTNLSKHSEILDNPLTRSRHPSFPSALVVTAGSHFGVYRRLSVTLRRPSDPWTLCNYCGRCGLAASRGRPVIRQNPSTLTDTVKTKKRKESRSHNSTLNRILSKCTNGALVYRKIQQWLLKYTLKTRYIHSNASALSTPALSIGILSACTITLMSPARIPQNSLTHTPLIQSPLSFLFHKCLFNPPTTPAYPD